MRGKNIDIKGINRHIGSPDNDDGYCSELINLKPQNGLKVVGNKVVKSANIPYTDIKIHKIGKVSNYIGIKRDADGVYVHHFDPNTGLMIHEIARFDAGSEVYFTLLNNQCVISNKTAIKLEVHIFEDGTYKPLYSGLDFNPSISILSTQAHTNEKYVEEWMKMENEDELRAMVQANINKYEKENPTHAEGYFLYAFTLTYYDGTESSMFNLGFCNAFRNTAQSNDFIQNTGVESGNDPKLRIKINFSGYYGIHTLNVTKNTTLYGKYKDLVSKVNLYVSKPLSRYPIVEEYAYVSTLGSDLTTQFLAMPRSADKSGLEKELLYKQKSWTLREFCNNGINGYKLKFGGDEQTTGATMEVFGPNADRAGKMFTYNKKVHYYDTNVRLHLEQPKVEYKPYGYIADQGFEDYTTAKADAIVYIRTGEKMLSFRYNDCNVWLVKGMFGNSDYNLALPAMLMVADSRAERVEFVITSCASNSSLAGRKYTAELTPSPAYNYAYYFGDNILPVTSYEIFDGKYPEPTDTYSETNTINVSANGMPMVFPVAYSYKFDGNITALSVAMQQISDAQVGQWPVNVLTDNGIYALQQGNGAVLYSNIIPLTGDTCVNPSVCYTSQGTAYISNGAVYLINGRNTTKMSLLLEGQPDTYVQNNESFLKCCGGSLYNISSFLSQKDFREYVDNAKLSWCANTNELIVSNPAYPYSYVYDFVYNAWYKVMGTYEGIEDNLILKPVMLNDGSEAPATCKVTLNALHSEQTKQISVQSKAAYPTALSCGAGHNIALVIDGTQVASAVFTQITYTPMMMAVLCESISYLEDEPGMLYSKTDLSGKVVRLYNTSTKAEIFSATFSATAESVLTPDKAIGGKITLTIGNIAYNEVFLASSSAVTLLNNLADKVNNNDTSVFASVRGNSIVLTAKQAGSAGNNIPVAVTTTDSNYIYISATAMTGGANISLEPSDYKEIIDWSLDEPANQQTVHLHTRPMMLDNPHGYKTIRRALINCLAQLKGQQNLSLYIYASNDLVNYKCVAAAQRQDCDIAQITTDRVAKAYKYFIFMIGGTVDNNTQIGHIALAIEDVVNKKLR